MAPPVLPIDLEDALVPERYTSMSSSVPHVHY